MIQARQKLFVSIVALLLLNCKEAWATSPNIPPRDWTFTVFGYQFGFKSYYRYRNAYGGDDSLVYDYTVVYYGVGRIWPGVDDSEKVIAAGATGAAAILACILIFRVGRRRNRATTNMRQVVIGESRGAPVEESIDF